MKSAEFPLYLTFIDVIYKVNSLFCNLFQID
uniref:Uncharacterized protein n=1 Tax=Rhizophora mucronata TaxID=61149 RepID=A0A2P2QZF4_RHIMU